MVFKKFRINKNYLNIYNKESLKSLSIILKKKIYKFDDNFFKLLRINNLRMKVFDCMNMHVELDFLNYKIYKILKKKINKKLLIWTFPQVRVDGSFANQFSAPLHKDEWILDPKKKGFVVWFPISKKGGSILISKNNKTKIHAIDNYWGIRSNDKKKFIKVFLKYGEAIIFRHNILHKSSLNENRITVQLRFEELNSKFEERSVTQKTNPKVLKYWKRKLT